MSDFLDQMVGTLNEKLSDASFNGSVKVDVEDVGSVVFSEDGAAVSDAPADVTLSADGETLESLFAGDLDPTSAFMSGKLKIDGDMGLAMQLASVLA